MMDIHNVEMSNDWFRHVLQTAWRQLHYIKNDVTGGSGPFEIQQACQPLAEQFLLQGEVVGPLA